jgi:hypothetical protein
MRPAIKADGSKYYEYVFCYVDDILVVSERPKRIMAGLEAKYVLKAGSVDEPKMYLWDKVSKYQLKHSKNPDKVHWSLLAEDYVNHVVKDVETELDKVGKALPTKVMTPMTADYCLELDQSKELGPSHILRRLDQCLVLVHRARTNRYHCGGVSVVSLSCLSSRGTHATSIPCLWLLEEACPIMDGV